MTWPEGIPKFSSETSGLINLSHSRNQGTLIYTSQTGRWMSPGVFVASEKIHDDKGET